MRQFLSEYENENEKNLNLGIKNREFDEPLVDYIVDACKSLEVLSNINFLGYSYTEIPTEIDDNHYISTRSTKVKDQKVKYLFTKINRTGELKLKFNINWIDRKTGEYMEKDITKKMLLPILDDDGYYHLKGKKFYLLYQLIESSTYNTKDGVVLRSLLAVCIKRGYKDIKEINGEKKEVSVYTVTMFKKDRPILPFYLANLGMTKTLRYFYMDDIIDFTDKPLKNDDVYYYFKMSSTVYVKVRKRVYDEQRIVQSMIGMIIEASNSRVTMRDLDNKIFWVERLGILTSTTSKKVDNYVEKGYTILTYFNRMVDITTQKQFKLHPGNKKNIYAIVRYMVMEFDELRRKDNLDITHKKLRYNGIMGALFTQVLSDRLNRLISKGKRINGQSLQDLFAFQGNILLSLLHKSGLLRYDDNINDLTLFNFYKYSMKGKSTQKSNGKTVSKKQRSLNPSLIGTIDLTTSGSSDPRSSGVLIPFTKIKSLEFSDMYEPESSKIHFEQYVNDLLREDGIEVITDFTDESNYFDNDERYNNILASIKLHRVDYEDDGNEYEEILIYCNHETEFSDL